MVLENIMIHVIQSGRQSVSWLVDQFFIHFKVHVIVETKTMRTTGIALATISIFNVFHALENTESDAINSLPNAKNYSS